MSKHQLIILCIISFLISCDSSTSSTPKAPESEKIFKNIPRGSSTDYTYFSFSEGDTVEVTNPATDTNWDIGFGVANTYYSGLITNGGVSGSGNGGAISYKDTLYSEVTEVPAEIFAQDVMTDGALAPAIPLGSDNSWYHYDSADTHRILPTSRHALIVKTATGQYAKVQILSYYYQNEDGTTDYDRSRYFTFKYVYQADSDSKRLDGASE